MFMHLIWLEYSKWLVLHLQPALKIDFNESCFVSLALDLKVWQILASVYPEPNCSLYLQHDWNKYFLDHFWILNSFGILEHLFNRWVNCWSLGFDGLHSSSDPPLNDFKAAFELHLVYPHILILPRLSDCFQMLQLSLYLKSWFLSHLEDCSYEDLEFDDVADYDEGEYLLFNFLILDVPIILDDVVNIEHSLDVSES